MPKPRTPQINWSNPITRGLSSCLPMFERGGSSVNDLVQRSSPTLNGAMTWKMSPFGPNLNAGGASTDFVKIKSGGLISALKNSSVVLWINTTQNSATAGHPLYCERAASGNDIWKFGMSGTNPNVGKMEFIHRDDTGTLDNHVALSSVLVNDGNWHQVALTKSGLNILTYVDAISSGSAILTGGDTLTDASMDIRIAGDQADSASVYQGNVLTCLVWNRTISPTELKQLYTNPWQIYTQPIVSPVANAQQVIASTNQYWRNLMGVGI